MKYTYYCIDNDSLSKEGIKLCREDFKGQSLWPHRELVPIVHLPMRSVDDIYKGLSGFIKY